MAYFDRLEGWRTEFDKKCKRCGSQKNLEFHHINGKRLNSNIILVKERQNLVLLCHDCHSILTGSPKINLNLYQMEVW
jgi:5-methylcytosine-specific restriction endonuclease McrA